MGNEVDININPVPQQTSNQTAVFDPPKIVVYAGDLVYWRNNDPKSGHQPMPAGGVPDAWVKSPIPKLEDDQPATSNPVSFSAGTNIKGQDYICALHNNEAGTIVAVNLININSKAGAQPTDPQVAFAPLNMTVKVNECFVWSNNDVNPHWPAPSVDQKTAWLQQAVPAGQNSPVVTIPQANPTGVNYVCALHPNEKGTLKIVTPSA